jgi:hypothetical protein
VPILLLVQAVKNARAKKDAAQTPQA